MKLRYLLGAFILVIGYFVTRPRLAPIGGGWAIGHSRFGSSKALVRVRDHGLVRRTTVSKGLTEHRYFKPDCVLYRATSSFDGRVYLAVCGDRTPVTVQSDEFKMISEGLTNVPTQDTVDGIAFTNERHVPIGRILRGAMKAPRYSSSDVPTIGPWRQMEITFARFPLLLTEINWAGHTALHDAVSNGCVDWVKAILSYGVFPDLVDEKGITALMLTAVMQADTGLAPILADTLLRAGAHIDAQATNGMTALMYAKRANAGNVYQLLLDTGADPNLTHAGGETASQMAAVAGYDALSRSPNQPQSGTVCPAIPAFRP